MSSPIEIMSAEHGYSIVGGNGIDVITDTTAHTGSWSMMEVDADATFTKFTCENIFVNGAATTVTELTLPTLKTRAGAKLYGRITAVTLSAGSVVLYR